MRDEKKQVVMPPSDVFSKSLFQIADLLEIDKEDLSLIFSVEPSDIDSWKIDAYFFSSNEDFRAQMLNLVMINKSLRAIFSNKGDRVLWLQTFHTSFNQRPLDLLREGKDGAEKLAHYLEAAHEHGA